MKTCPQCKSTLTKSHSSRLKCRVCGFITKNLQIAQHNEQFQQRHHFSTKIAQKRVANSELRTIQQEDNEGHYLLSFQKCLRTAGTHFVEKYGCESIDKQLRILWFSYLKAAEREGLKIGGIFDKRLKDNVRREQKIQEQLNEEINPQEHQKKGETCENRVQTLKNSEKSILSSEQEPRQELISDKSALHPSSEAEIKRNTAFHRKRGRPRRGHTAEPLQHSQTTKPQRLTYKQLIRQKKASLIKTNLSIEQQSKQFLLFIYADLRKDVTHKQLLYAAQKYISMLIYNNRREKQRTGEMVSKRVKIGVKELKELISERNHNFEIRDQILIVVLLQDLLKLWTEQLQIMSNSNFEQMILTFQKYSDRKHKFIIEKLIAQLLTFINQTHFDIKKPVDEHIPQLCYKLIYSLIYIAVNIKRLTYGMSEVIIGCGGLQISYNAQVLRNQEKMSIFSLRKYCAFVYGFLGLRQELDITGIDSWIQKYCRIAGIPQKTMIQINKLNSLILPIYKQQKLKESVQTNKRIDFLQQDYISKVLIIIYLKLHFGLDNNAYLVNFPAHLLNKLDNPQQAELIAQIINQKTQLLNLIEIMRGFSAFYAGSMSQLAQFMPVSSYSSLDHLCTRNLIKQVQKWKKNRVNENLLPRPKQTHHLLPINPSVQLVSPKTPEKTYRVSQRIHNQLQTYKDNRNIKQLEQPAQNYEFFYEYTTNINYANRQVFVYLVQNIAAGESKLSRLYEWMTRIEKVLRQFENQ